MDHITCLRSKEKHPESTESDPKIDLEIDPEIDLKPQEPKINPKLQEYEVDRTTQPPVESRPQPLEDATPQLVPK